MRVAPPVVAQPLVASPGPRTGAAADKGTRFGAALRAQGPGAAPRATSAGGPLRRPDGPRAPTELVDVITRLRRDERRLDRHLKRALAGHPLDMGQLVALQSLAFRYSQRVELLGKLVDRLTGAVKQTLQMQI